MMMDEFILKVVMWKIQFYPKKVILLFSPVIWTINHNQTQIQKKEELLLQTDKIYKNPEYVRRAKRKYAQKRYQEDPEYLFQLRKYQ